jgi:hypothetical protein
MRVVLFSLVALIAVTSCSKSSPGPLAGKWKADGIFPLTVVYRDGEEESMGLITKVKYATEGRDVLVTYQDGLMKGTTMRYTMVSPSIARSPLVTLRRVERR